MGIMGINGVMEAHVDNGKRGGGVADGGVAGLEKGERKTSPSSSGPRSSSASLRRLLALFAGGVFTSGSERGSSVVGDGGAVFGRVASSQAGAATSDEGGGGHSRLPLAAVAARLRRLQQRRWQRRRLPAVAAVMVGTGRMHVTVMACRPPAWLTAMCALRPLYIQSSYNAAETDGGGLGLAGSPTQVATPPPAKLAHVGEAREVGGRGKGSIS